MPLLPVYMYCEVFQGVHCIKWMIIFRQIFLKKNVMCILYNFLILPFWNDPEISYLYRRIRKLSQTYSCYLLLYVFSIKFVLSVFDVTSSPSYITSVDDEDTGRIFDIACCQAGSRAVTMVTAGTELKVWKQVPSAE